MKRFFDLLNNLLADAPAGSPGPMTPTQIANMPCPDLGPKQLQWCRDNLGIFQSCEAQVIASRVATASQSDGE